MKKYYLTVKYVPFTLSQGVSKLVFRETFFIVTLYQQFLEKDKSKKQICHQKK